MKIGRFIVNRFVRSTDTVHIKRLSMRIFKKKTDGAILRQQKYPRAVQLMRNALQHLGDAVIGHSDWSIRISQKREPHVFYNHTHQVQIRQSLNWHTHTSTSLSTTDRPLNRTHLGLRWIKHYCVGMMSGILLGYGRLMDWNNKWNFICFCNMHNTDTERRCNNSQYRIALVTCFITVCKCVCKGEGTAQLWQLPVV